MYHQVNNCPRPGVPPWLHTQVEAQLAALSLSAALHWAKRGQWGLSLGAMRMACLGGALQPANPGIAQLRQLQQASREGGKGCPAAVVMARLLDQALPATTAL